MNTVNESTDIVANFITQSNGEKINIFYRIYNFLYEFCDYCVDQYIIF